MIDIGTDELYELASIAKSDPYGHPHEQILDNFGNFRCLMTPSLIMWLIDSLREAEMDAAMYWWLRDSDSMACAQFLNAKARMLDGDFLDSIVDSDMKEKGDE